MTFLFTDVQGSSALWEENPDSMAEAMAEHDRRIRDAVAEHDGYVFTTAGDSFSVAFQLPSHAVAAAVAAQLLLVEPPVGPRIRVRMALHTGTATERDGDYFGQVLNRCARLMVAGHGGQVLLSETTATLLRDELKDLALVDLGEHLLKDLSRPERIYQLSHPSLESAFPRLRTVDAVSTNLPIQLTSFVGRDAELADVSQLLADSRLVTLAGPGGSGKTRLALQVAAESPDHFPGGIGLVELAPITDPELVDDAFAATFDATEAPGTPLVQAIATKIGERDLLLVVDNCEHLVDTVAGLVAELLATSPGLKVLATSQIQLGIAGEIVYRVPSLAVPDSAADVATARTFDAVELFLERAVLAKPSFELTAANVDAVVAICRRLDGIPLAIELAAARLAVLSPQQISQRLDERFALLAGGPRLADARHQTLQATIDWSHDLLTDAEKALFRRCGIFSGTFGIDAVEAVVAGEPVDNRDALDLLMALVDKSLVTAEDENNQVRYRLLESMRQYAIGQLEAEGETASSAIKHLGYFADYAEELKGTDLGEALRGMQADRDNLRAALEFGMSNGHLTEAGRIIGGIGYLWYIDGTYREGIDWCARFFSLDPDLLPPLMASVLHSYGTLLGSWSEPAAGAEMLEREVELRRQLDEPARLASALNNVGGAWIDAGHRRQGEAALLEAVDLYRSIGESPAMPLSALGWGNMAAGDFGRAMEYYEEALHEALATDDAYALALATASMGQCATHLGRFEEARPLLEEGRQRFADLGVTPGVQDADLHLALVDRAEGHVVDAANRLLGFLGDPESHWYLAGKFWVIQVAASILEDPVVAAQLLGEAAAYYDSVNEVQPAFVRMDLEKTRQRLVEGLGDEAFDRHFGSAGRATHADTISVATRALAAITA